MQSKILAKFREFLLNLIIDSINCCFLIYENKINARQKLNQKIIVFKNYLNKLKIYLLSLSKKYKIYIFLAKLKSKLKSKILNIDNISNMREKLLTIVIMQKQNINCLRITNKTTQNKSRIIKNSNIFLNKIY